MHGLAVPPLCPALGWERGRETGAERGSSRRRATTTTTTCGIAAWLKRLPSRNSRLDFSSTAVVGAGPQALALLVHLREAGVAPERLPRVVDDSGEFLSSWHANFAAQEIEYLRSPVVHHSGTEGMALREYAEAHHRMAEVRPAGKTAVPSQRLFAEYEAELQDGLGDAVHKGRVAMITPPLSPSGHFKVGLHSGDSFEARRVVYCGGNGRPNVPAWVEDARAQCPAGRLLHSSEVSFPSIPDGELDGAHVAIVGGGLTSAHLAAGVLRRGGRVTLLARAPEIRVQWFDFPPIWVGAPRIDALGKEADYALRADQVFEARGGGSITPALLDVVLQAQAEGSASIMAGTDVSAVAWDASSRTWDISVCQGPLGEGAGEGECSPAPGAEWGAAPGDGVGTSPGAREEQALVGVTHIYVATGTVLDAGAVPELAEVREAYPAQLYRGLPPLSPTLAWPGLPELHIMGGLAGLVLGPASRNLAGARMGARRIAGEMLSESGGENKYEDRFL